MNLYSYKNMYANVFANEFCFYMILASCFKKTQCNSLRTQDQLRLYYTDLVRDNSGYDNVTGQWKSSCSYVRQERMEDMYIPMIEGKLAKQLSSNGWDIASDQAEVFIEPAMKIVRERKKRARFAVCGHIFRFVGLRNELHFQIVEVNRRCKVLIRVKRPGENDVIYQWRSHSSGKKR